MTAAEFTGMYSAWRPRFEALACRYVRSRPVVEDIVSDSFMAFWERRHHIPAGSNIEAYIFTIVRHRCLSWLRTQSIHSKAEEKIFTVRQRVMAEDIRSLQALDPGELFSGEVASLARESFGKLPELTRNVFMDRRIEELSHKAISEKHGITLRRVESELAKAVKHLRAALKDYLPLLLVLLLTGVRP